MKHTNMNIMTSSFKMHSPKPGLTMTRIRSLRVALGARTQSRDHWAIALHPRPLFVRTKVGCRTYPEFVTPVQGEISVLNLASKLLDDSGDCLATRDH